MTDLQQDAQRIEEFLKDPVVQRAFVALEGQCLAAFKSAKTDDERRDAQALARAGDSLIVELARVVDAATRERTEQDRRDRAAAAR